jgi:hypothetical protein
MALRRTRQGGVGTPDGFTFIVVARLFFYGWSASIMSEAAAEWLQ